MRPERLPPHDRHSRRGRGIFEFYRTPATSVSFSPVLRRRSQRTEQIPQVAELAVNVAKDEKASFDAQQWRIGEKRLAHTHTHLNNGCNPARCLMTDLMHLSDAGHKAFLVEAVAYQPIEHRQYA